ncbi:MAG: T9SS type A sorting domain-containing protein [Bacteroidota bacterium]|nr:T9SS type A sorting domain-containing protein [Bacteroidota bacterium]
MKVKLGLFLFLITAGLSYGQESWKKKGIKIPPPVCYGSNVPHPSFVKPPVEFYEHLKSASTQTTTIEVTYFGFPPEAQQAFQYAVDIWKSLIYSPVPIRVRAVWTSLGKGVLGSTGSTDYFKNFNSTEVWNCYYSVALVEKMLGGQVNSPTDYEIDASFNKDFANWYFGTDGKTPFNQYDFVSTVLHELAHGLGFIGNFYSASGRGGYSSGADYLPAAFDLFVVNKKGEKLVNTKLFTNPSTLLNQNLTSGWLEFNSRMVDGQIPRLFAPTSWDTGSSIYHLDESTYPVSDVNSLMTPYADMGEAIHDPGPDALAMLYDIGWKNISIRHKSIKDIEYVSSPINFDAQLISDYGLDTTKLFLVYSRTPFIRRDSVRLAATNVNTVFNAQLNQTSNGEVRYFFSATDVKNRRYVFPSGSPAQYLSFNIGIDNTPPVLKHEPVKLMLTDKLSAKIDVVATDNIGIKSVKLEYFVNGGPKTDLTLNNDSNDQYSVNLTFPEGTVKDGDEVSYRIIATDISSQSNIGRLPLTGYFPFKIQLDKEAPVLIHKPIKYLLTTNLTTKMNVRATDNLGVKSVKLEYFINEGTNHDLILKNDSGNYYSADLVLSSSSVKNGDLVHYRFVATDISSQSNTGYLPLSGNFSIKIEGIENPVDKYVTDFNTVNTDFIGTDFNVSTATGFDNPALNSAHPYLSPDTDNTNFNFSAMLRYPIVLKAGGKMSFDEIVLVEPGDPGTKFGDENFYDYVIVEGSTDNGTTWKPVIDGYDSGAKSTWANLFNKGISGNNSTSVPTKDLFVKREIDMLANGNFSAGDTIMVRFRLFSDPYSNGWGWIIDNLNIQDIGTAVNPILLSSGEVNFSPNPATNELTLQIQAQKNIHKLMLKAYNSSGIPVYSRTFPVSSSAFQTAIDVSSFRPGLYLFTVEPENGQLVTRKILIQ